MLTLLVGLVLQGTSQTAGPILPGVSVRDTTPPENPVGVPFTRDEYVRAQMQVRSREASEALASRLFDAPEVIGAHLMDGDLLLLALLSDELAARVTAWRPSLRAQVEEFRRDPERTLESWKAAIRDSPPPS